ncbi:cytochrome P450 [Pseudaestuariivita atlantica]|uniref:Cytochrome P450 n=1 Tax=Pseudaestuariivita atlantica TaxID=1317121 RepID=A0A0L1JP22_9RHOB|nr:cytochrome P450 [Pseudaestuariivita atlantica]KNG93515.1 hypothetical protein ATO11_09855 [Pseudaestuariivita atlantica]
MTDLPFLDITAPGFSTRGPEMQAARAAHWCARTPLGLAVLRHRQAGLILRDRRLRQGSYAWPDTPGLEGSFADFWRRSIISMEGPDHKALRRVAMAALAPDFILSLTDHFTAAARELVGGVRDVPTFDFIERISEPFAGRAITALLGMEDEQADWLALQASTLGKGMGLDAKRFEDQVNAATDALMDLARDLIARAQTGRDKTSFVARAVAEGGLSDEALQDLVVISIFGGVDTTRAQLAFAMELFAAHPGQWTRLRETRDRVPQAVEEIIRTRPTTTWSTREALEDLEVEGVGIEAGETVHIWVNATGTDPAIDASNGFDVFADRKVHFGFGGGAHHCLGQFVARTDMACALNVLLDTWAGVQVSGTPTYLPDSGNTSPLSFEIRPEWSALSGRGAAIHGRD